MSAIWSPISNSAASRRNLDLSPRGPAPRLGIGRASLSLLATIYRLVNLARLSHACFGGRAGMRIGRPRILEGQRSQDKWGRPYD